MWRHSHILKKRKVRRVIGWLLSLQLRSPGWGWVCAFSIVYAVELWSCGVWSYLTSESSDVILLARIFNRSATRLTTFVLHHQNRESDYLSKLRRDLVGAARKRAWLTTFVVHHWYHVWACSATFIKISNNIRIAEVMDIKITQHQYFTLFPKVY